MKIEKTFIKDLFLIKFKSSSDSRGVFKEVFRKDLFENKIGSKISFCQDNLVHSDKMVLRGLHFQTPPYEQSKLIYLSLGEILDVAVDLRKNSKTYGKHFSTIISSQDNNCLFIPKGFAHGYLTLSDKAIINYKVDNFYSANHEKIIPFDDNFLKIDWKFHKQNFIITEKDKMAK